MSHTNLARRAQNAVCVNGVGYDGDSPNDASYDVSNHTFRTLMLVGRSSQNENPAQVCFARPAPPISKAMNRFAVRCDPRDRDRLKDCKDDKGRNGPVVQIGPEGLAA